MKTITVNKVGLFQKDNYSTVKIRTQVCKAFAQTVKVWSVVSRNSFQVSLLWGRVSKLYIYFVCNILYLLPVFSAYCNKKNCLDLQVFQTLVDKVGLLARPKKLFVKPSETNADKKKTMTKDNCNPCAQVEAQVFCLHLFFQR